MRRVIAAGQSLWGSGQRFGVPPAPNAGGLREFDAIGGAGHRIPSLRGAMMVVASVRALLLACLALTGGPSLSDGGCQGGILSGSMPSLIVGGVLRGKGAGGHQPFVAGLSGGRHGDVEMGAECGEGGGGCLALSRRRDQREGGASQTRETSRPSPEHGRMPAATARCGPLPQVPLLVRGFPLLLRGGGDSGSGRNAVQDSGSGGRRWAKARGRTASPMAHGMFQNCSSCSEAAASMGVVTRHGTEVSKAASPFGPPSLWAAHNVFPCSMPPCAR